MYTYVFVHTWYLVTKVTSGHLEHTPSATFLLLLFVYPPPSSYWLKTTCHLAGGFVIG